MQLDLVASGAALGFVAVVVAVSTQVIKRLELRARRRPGTA